MDESRLNALLKDVPNYLGSFAVDEVNQIEIKRLPEFFVINLNTRESGGNHWIAFAVYQNHVYICDALGGLIPGRYFPKKLINFLHLLIQNRNIHITKQLQPLDSSTCGKYCVLFVKEMSQTNNFSSFLSLFTTNVFQNDNIISFLQ